MHSHSRAAEMMLPPISAGIYSFSGTEPQYISTRVPNQGWLYIASKDAPPGANRADCQMGDTSIMAVGMGRLKILGFATIWNIPNVNPRNNVISFWSSATGFPPTPGAVLHTTAPLNERWYDENSPVDEAALLLDIKTKMNALSGASGLAFDTAPVPGFPHMNVLFISAGPPGATYLMNQNCLAVAKGQQMFGFPSLPPVAASSSSAFQFIINYIYTQFIDITSTTLSKWDKMQSTSTGNTNPIIMRAYVGGGGWGLQFQDITTHPVEISWKADEPITYFDIKIYDQNGDPLYVLNGGKQFIWQLSMLAEM